MPNTRPLLILPNTAFTQCGVRENVESISIYSTRRVEVLTKHGRKNTIQPHDLSWPQFAQMADFVAYLKVCHFQLRQFNAGGYRLISMVRGLGRGNGQSISSNQARLNAAKTRVDDMLKAHDESGNLVGFLVNALIRTLRTADILAFSVIISKNLPNGATDAEIQAQVNKKRSTLANKLALALTLSNSDSGIDPDPRSS